MKTRKTILVIALCLGVLLFLETCVTEKTEIPLPDVAGETWDYVILGSSIGTCWARDYGALVESDLDVKIVYHSYYVGGQPVGQLLQSVIKIEKLREDIRSAEVITIGVGYADMYFDAIQGYDFGQYEQKELEEKIEVFSKTYNSMLDEILALASPGEKIIRVMDFYFPDVARYKEKNTYDVISRYWNAFNSCIHQAARERKIPVALVCTAFNGITFQDDPVRKGYIGGDGIHPSEQGMELIAAEFRKLGYGYASP